MVVEIGDANLMGRVLSRLEESEIALRSAVERGYDRWIITFSGGKDSTTTLVIALETALSLLPQVERIDVVYSDTMIEIPVIQQYALGFLEYLKGFHRVASLPLHYHVVYPAIEERFWVCLLGKGYPPPHWRFRWCTRRLKITPVENALKSFVRPDKTVVLTGVRFGESRDRDARLHSSCSRGGECGQDMWFKYGSRLRATHLAPIVNWDKCDVWDFLRFYAPALGYPTHHLEESVYNGRETRFGCWMCTVVRQDRAMERIVSRPEWSHLRPLRDFRQHVMELTARAESRVPRPDGRPGRLTLATREQLLEELLGLEADVGIPLVSDEEVRIIHDLWSETKNTKR